MQANFSVEESVGNLWEKLNGWLDAIILKLPNLVMAILVMVLFYFLAKAIRNVLKRTILKRIAQVSIQEIVAKVLFIIVILMGFFIALGVLDLDKVLTSILAGAGVVGLAIGLALQGTLSNTFGGLILSFMPQLKINDFITADGISGFVTEISLRNIILKKSDNTVVVIPNSKFIDGSFTNYSLTDRNRVFLSCGVGYESDLQMVEDLTVKIINDNFEQKNGEAVEFFFTEFGDSSINFMVRFWVDVISIKQEHAARHKAIKLIKQHFDERGINIPFPIRTLDFGKNNLQIVKESSTD